LSIRLPVCQPVTRTRTLTHTLSLCSFFAATAKAKEEAEADGDDDKKSNNKVPFAELSKRCGEKWRAMGKEEKAPYVERAKELKEAAAAAAAVEQEEEEDAEEEAEEAKKMKKKKKKKKAPKSAYQLFVKEYVSFDPPLSECALSLLVIKRDSLLVYMIHHFFSPKSCLCLIL